MDQNNQYRCRDLYLASFIYSQGQEFIKIERLGNICWFIFKDKSSCDQLESLFWANKASANPRSFSDSIRTLKSLIFTG